MSERIDYTEEKLFATIDQYLVESKKLLLFNEMLFDSYPDLNLEELDPNKKILSRWNQTYDAEQLFEHAIVHILKHRRQIERFKLQLHRH